MTRILTRWLRWSGPVTRTAILDRYPFDPAWLDAALGALVTGRAVVQGHFLSGGPELEYCDREIFEQLYRRTLNLLRREVQPVPLPAYQAFLLKWQGVGPAERGGAHRLVPVLRQVRGLALPASAWEREVFPARGIAHPWRELDAVVRRGDYTWVAAGVEGRAGLRFVARREGGLFLADPLTGLDDGPAGEVFAYLKSEGPSFFADIQGGVRLSTPGLRDALRELALAGAVTGEDMDALAAVLQVREEPSVGRPMSSSLAEDLAQRRPPHGAGQMRGGARPSPQRLREQRRLVGRRVEAEVESEQGWAGRWALVNRAAIMGPAPDGEERAARFVRVALERYGLLTPEIVSRFESRWTWAEEAPAEPHVRALWEGRHELLRLHGPRELAWTWGELSQQLGRMELRGEVRRGYFVHGLSGVQYALPQAVEALRAARDRLGERAEVTLLSALDPVNLYGGELGVLATEHAEPAEDEGEVREAGLPTLAARFARVASTHVALHQGVPVLVAEDSGARLTAAEASPDVLAEAVKLYLNRTAAPRRTEIKAWNAGPVLGSAGEPLLRGLGATRSPTGLDYWRGV